MASKVALSAGVPFARGRQRGHVRSTGLRFDPTLIFLVLLAATVAVWALDVFTFELNRVAALEQVRRTFDVNEEPSIPTWFSSIQLFVAAALLAGIALVKFQRHDGYARHWALLALIICGLSIDEIAMIHENSTIITGKFAGAVPWTAGGAVAVGLVGLLYARFMLALPRRIAVLFCVGAAILVFGALGIDFFELDVSDAYSQGLAFEAMVSIEEFCERLGVAIFIYALLVYAKDHMGIGGFAIVPAAGAEPADTEITGVAP